MKQEEIQQELIEIKQRNKRVEASKAWENSWQRKSLVLIITYIFMVFFMNIIGVEGVYVNAMIPTFGFFLSTLSVGFLKKSYIKKYLNNNK